MTTKRKPYDKNRGQNTDIANISRIYVLSHYF